MTKFVNVEEGVVKSPFVLCPWILDQEWTDFVRMKTTNEFKLRSLATRERAINFKSPHNMGTYGYAGMAPIWAKEDAQAVSEGRTPVLSHIANPKARSWTRARAKSYDESTGQPVFYNDDTSKKYKELVRVHMLIFCITS